LSANAASFHSHCLKLIIENCPNLIYLNISKMDAPNFLLVKLFKRCGKLKEINLSNCTQITDSSVMRLFQHCKELETVNLTFCHLIEGKCFSRVHSKLKEIVLDQCEYVS
jgi:hypothetical protein